MVRENWPFRGGDMADISINIDEKLDKLDVIYKKINKLMKEEIDKISSDDT